MRTASDLFLTIQSCATKPSKNWAKFLLWWNKKQTTSQSPAAPIGTRADNEGLDQIRSPPPWEPHWAGFVLILKKRTKTRSITRVRCWGSIAWLFTSIDSIFIVGLFIFFIASNSDGRAVVDFFSLVISHCSLIHFLVFKWHYEMTQKRWFWCIF